MWWPLLGLAFFIGLLTENYQLSAFSGMLTMISLAALWWNRHVLDHVLYQRKFVYRRGYPGEIIPMRIEVQNRKFLSIPWLRIEDLIPYAAGTHDETQLVPTHLPEIGSLVMLFSLRWYQRERRTYQLFLRKRGVYHIGPAQIRSGDPFGFFDRSEERDQLDYLTVFPDHLDFQDLPFPPGDPFGDRRAIRRLFFDINQPMGVREYQPEDDFRFIHWPMTAHTNSLQVKVCQPVSARVLIVCLNAMTLPHYWEGTDPDLLEHLIKVATTIVEKAFNDGYRVGISSNSSFAHAGQGFRVPPGRSPQQLVRLLTMLASITPFVTATFDRFLMSNVSRMPFGATLLILSAVVDDALIQTLIKLKQHNRRIVLCSFAKNLTLEIPGITIYHFPFHRRAD
jgi:uncharacterized protein (DUF58 family)